MRLHRGHLARRLAAIVALTLAPGVAGPQGGAEGASPLTGDPPPAAPGAPPPAAASLDPHLYPFAVMVRLAPGSAAATFEHRPGVTGPANPAVVVALGDQARSAYAAVTARVFQPSTAGEVALRLEISVRPATLDRSRGAWRVTVRHEVAVTSADGRPVASWTVAGEDEVRGLGDGAISAAFARAARTAAEAFEQRFDASPEVAAWLVAHGQRRRAPRTPEPDRPVPPRPAWNDFVDFGMGTMDGSAFAVRAGLGGRWLFVQAGLDRWRRSFDAAPYQPGDLATWVLGVEAGAVLRLSERLELRSGLGVGWLSTTATLRDYRFDGSGATMSIPKSGVLGSWSGALAYVTGPQTRFAGRGRLALEGRLYTGTDVRLDAIDKTLSAGQASILLLVGFELPAGL